MEPVPFVEEEITEEGPRKEFDARDLKAKEDKYGMEERREQRLKDFASYGNQNDKLDLTALEKSSQKSTITFCPFCGTKVAAPIA